METYVAHPIDEAQAKAVEAIFEALQVPYDKEPDIYTPEFNEKMRQSDANYAAGRYEAIKIEDLWK